MPETPYCPLLSINKDVPVMCQEELCMWYVKQFKLCAATVLAYTNAMNIQVPKTGGMPPTTGPAQKPQAASPQGQVKTPLTKEPQKPDVRPNPFALDDLE